MFTTTKRDDPARDPLAADGHYWPSHAPWGAVRRWVNQHTTTHRTPCPDCGHPLVVTAQFIATTSATLYRYPAGCHAEPGDTRDTPPDWRRVCPCATYGTPTTHEHAQEAAA